MAGGGERLVARLVDGAVWFGIGAVLVGVEAIIRRVTGWEETAEGDGLSAVLGFALLAVAAGYDVVTTKLLGATVGKRALGLRVVGEDGTPAGAGVLLGRTLVTLVCWSVCLVPGLLDLRGMFSDPRRRTWHDKAVRTTVERGGRRDRAAAPGMRPPASLHGQPWRDLATRAAHALARYDGAVALMAAGPVRDTVTGLRGRLLALVGECEDLAVRGDRLAALLPPDRPVGPAATTGHPTAPLEQALRLRVAQLDAAAHHAIALAAVPPDGEGVDDVALELRALGEALRSLSPPDVPPPPHPRG